MYFLFYKNRQPYQHVKAKQQQSQQKTNNIYRKSPKMIFQLLQILFSIIIFPLELVYNLVLIPFTFSFEIISIIMFIFTIIFGIISTIISTLYSLISLIFSFLFFLPAIVMPVLYVLYKVATNIVGAVLYLLEKILSLLQVVLNFVAAVVQNLLWALKNVVHLLYSSFWSSIQESNQLPEASKVSNESFCSATFSNLYGVSANEISTKIEEESSWNLSWNTFGYLTPLLQIFGLVFLGFLAITYCARFYRKYSERRFRKNRQKYFVKFAPERKRISVQTSHPTSQIFASSTKKLKETYRVFCCPITCRIIKQPGCLKCGHSFEKQSVIQALKIRPVCPLCVKPNTYREVFDNFVMKEMVNNFVEEVRSKGKVWAETENLVELLDEDFWIQ